MAILQFVCLVLLAIVLTGALAHALEYPGKMRLDRETYMRVQAIYYPGFTRAGLAEPAAIVALLALVLVTPAGTADFWLTAGALAAAAAVQAIYWLRTHPVNRLWLRETGLAKADARFFGSGAVENATDTPWQVLRDQWESSHIARAAFAGASFILLAIAVTT